MARDATTTAAASPAPAATAAAPTGLRRTHRHARSHPGTGRADTGSPAWNRARSAANSAAVG